MTNDISMDRNSKVNIMMSTYYIYFGISIHANILESLIIILPIDLDTSGNKFNYISICMKNIYFKKYREGNSN